MDTTLLIPLKTPTGAGHKFFRLFLDPTMSWSSAYFSQDGMTLEEAQVAKYERLCAQLHLSAADHVLEIGTGWGSNAIHMARRYGCRVTTTTMSEEQYTVATRRVKAADLGHRITILLEDYRDLAGRFDKVVSVEMLDTAGRGDIETWLDKSQQWLKKDGIVALQVVTGPDFVHIPIRTGEMTLTDLKDLSLHYAATLKVWLMQLNSRLREIKALGFDQRFIKKWNDYLLDREFAFRHDAIHAMQLVYSRRNGSEC